MTTPVPSSSPTTTVSTASSSSPSSTKRHSVHVGPRALHLVEGTSLHDAVGDESASGSSSRQQSRTSSPVTTRRQSSISYKSPEREWFGPLSPGHTLLSAHDETGTGSSPMVPVMACPVLPPDRPPLTLAEKHSDLLHFIAQKEAKCLELRTQLATHEAELLQLKRKWERIVSRRYGGDEMTTTTAMATTGNNSSSSHSHVLEGIREGVQGVGRFLSAGLDFSLAQHKRQGSVSGASRVSSSSGSSVDEETSQEVVVNYTDATPTMSPLVRRRPSSRHEKRGSVLLSGMVSALVSRG